MINNDTFVNMLVSHNIVDEFDARLMLDQNNENAFEVVLEIIRKDIAPKNVMGNLWGDMIHVSYVDMERTLFQEHLLEKMPERFARKYKIIPLYQFGDVVTIATADPFNQEFIKEAEKLMSAKISVVFAFPDDIQDAIDIQYRSSFSFEEYAAKAASYSFSDISSLTSEQLTEIVNAKAVMNFTHALLLMSIKEKASDIHIEHHENLVRIRFRIDGILREKYTLDKLMVLPMVCRLKYLAKLDISEIYRPQKGQIQITLLNKSLYFELSTTPMIFGEKLVLRILNSRQKQVPEMAELNFPKSILNGLTHILSRPGGVLLVVGPARSGKTTTLVTLLKNLAAPDVNVTTIEDAIEYRLPDINRTRIDPENGFTSALALNSVIRQCPDIIYLGAEIDSRETANAIIQASQKGYQILTAVHATRIFDVIPKLIDLGISPYMLASAINGILGQRLVRRICNYCSEMYAPSPEIIEKYFIWDKKQEVFFYRGKGCDHCKHTGYHGQVAIFELLVFNQEIRSMIADGSSMTELANESRKYGYQPLWHDGIKKTLRGMTTIQELERVLGE